MSTPPSALDELVNDLRAFVAARDWRQFHDPKNLAMLVASEAGELVAEYRWVRGDQADAHSREPAARARVAAEVADVGIGLLLLCDRIGLDLVAAMKDEAREERRALPRGRVQGQRRAAVARSCRVGAQKETCLALGGFFS